MYHGLPFLSSRWNAPYGRQIELKCKPHCPAMSTLASLGWLSGCISVPVLEAYSRSKVPVHARMAQSTKCIPRSPSVRGIGLLATENHLGQISLETLRVQDHVNNPSTTP